MPDLLRVRVRMGTASVAPENPVCSGWDCDEDENGGNTSALKFLEDNALTGAGREDSVEFCKGNEAVILRASESIRST